MAAKKVATFIKDGRKEVIIDVPADELDKLLDMLAQEIIADLEAEIAKKLKTPGFVNDIRDR